MVAGKLPVGSKVVFIAEFGLKPTGVEYHFQEVDSLITISTNHNFVRDIPNECFGIRLAGNKPVKVYVTVKSSGKISKCSVDILEWEY